MGTLVDFHSHILPGIDDGSSSSAESLAMLRMEAQQGIGHVIATPHFYAHYDTPERFLARREASMNRLLRAAEGTVDLPKIDLGAEVYYFPGISDSEVLPRLTIAEKKCILIEMPPSPWTETMYRELEGIYVKQDLLPVIAHVDRYITPLRNYGIPQRLAELPVLVQANADFFLRRTTASFALRLLREDRIHVLGSDCHNLAGRAPNLGNAVRVIHKHLGDETVERIREREKEILSRWLQDEE